MRSSKSTIVFLPAMAVLLAAAGCEDADHATPGDKQSKADGSAQAGRKPSCHRADASPAKSGCREGWAFRRSRPRPSPVR